MAPLSGRKYWSGLILAVALSVAGFGAVVIFTSNQNQPVVLTQMRRSHFCLAVALMVGTWMVEGLRTKALLEITGSRIGFWPALCVHMASNFAASVTPLAGGGPPVETYLLWRRGIPLENSLTMVSSRLIFSYGFFLGAVPVLLFLGWNYLQLSGPLLAVTIGAMALMLLSFVLFFYFVFRPQLVGKVAGCILQLFPCLVRDPQRTKAIIEREVTKFNGSLRLLLQAAWWRLALIVGYTAVIWGLFFAVAPVLLMGLGIKVPWVTATARQIVLYFLVAFVPLPGASGVAEVGYASVFASLVPRQMLAGLVAVWRLLTYFAGIVVGLPFLVHLAREPAGNRTYHRRAPSSR